MRRGSWGPWLGAALVAALLVLPGPPGAAGAGGPVPHQLARATAESPASHLARRLPHDDDAVQPRSYPGLRLPPDARGGVVVPSHLHLLVARFHVGSTPRVPTTQQMTSLSKQTATWFHTVSRGRQSIGYRVTPWLSFPGSLSTLCENNRDVPTMVRRLTAAGLHPSSYNRLMFVMPQCATSSLGEIRGRVTWIREPAPRLATLVHELGHNLGLKHAYSLICHEGTLRVTLAGKCSPQEYGDLWDAMGLSVRPYSVPILERLGWAGRVATPRGSGTFTLADAEHSGTRLQALHVVLSAHRSYWLEFHPETLAQPAPFGIRGSPGVQIRLDTGGPSLRILDASPGNPDGSLIFPDADMVHLTMPAGTSFTTPEHVRITVLRQTATSARVRIRRGLKATLPGRPTLRGVLDTEPGYEHDLYLTPGNDGGQLILGYRVTSYPSGATTFVPRTSGTAPLQLVGHLGSSYDVRAVTQQGVSLRSSRAAVEPPGPVITGVTPAEGSSQPGHHVDLGVSAQPNRLTGSPVTSVDVCILSFGYCGSHHRDGTAPYSVSYPDLAAGSYAFRVSVSDQAGHTTELVRHVQLAGYPPSLSVSAPADGATLIRTFHVTGSTASTDPARPSAVPTVSVELLDSNGVTVRQETSTTASFDVLLTGVPQGTYTLRVTATDGAFADASPAVVRTVSVAETRPDVTIVTPADGAALSGQTTDLTLSIDHPEKLDTGAIAEIYVDGASNGYFYLSQAPYSGTIDLSGLATDTHQLRVDITDSYFGTWSLPTRSFTYSP